MTSEYVGRALDSGSMITPDDMRRFRQFFLDQIGVQLPDSKAAMVSSRLSKRVNALGLDSFHAYFKVISTPKEVQERQRAIDLITTNETYFFREPQHFDYLRRHILPEAAEAVSYRVWSAASSTGEEAYTLAMVLNEVRGPRPWQIEGSDISSRVLSFAKRGLYVEERGRHIPPALRSRYCLRGTGEYEGHFLVDTKLRQRVNFQMQNLLALEAGLGMFDLIFLRNVLIYFDLPTKVNVIQSICRHLKPKGYLIVGAAESLQGVTDELETCGKSIFRKRA